MLGAAILPLFDASMDLGVVDLPATWLGPGAFPAGTTTNANNTTASISVAPSYRPLAEYVNGSSGNCIDCTPSKLDADDDDFVQVDSTGTITTRAAYQITTAVSPTAYGETPGPVTVVYRGKASSSITQTLLIKNHTSGGFESLDSGTFQDESELAGSVAKGQHYKDSQGRVTVEIRGSGMNLAYSLFGDLLEARTSTDNATAPWRDILRLRAASDEPDSLDISATHVAMTNAARLTTVALYAADGTTRLILYGNGTVEEQSSTAFILAAGSTNAVEVRANTTAGSAASWTFDLVARTPSGSWTVTHRVTWTLSASS